MIRRCCDPHSTANRSTRSGIPGNVDVVAQRTARIGIGGNHWLVVEMVGPVFKREEVDRRISLPAIRRFCDGHFSSVDSGAITEEHHDVAVEDAALRIESQGWIGSKINSVGALRWR